MEKEIAYNYKLSILLNLNIDEYSCSYRPCRIRSAIGNHNETDIQVTVDNLVLLTGAENNFVHICLLNYILSETLCFSFYHLSMKTRM